MKKNKERDNYGVHYGDLGVIAMAMLFLFGFLFLMFDPAPLKGIDKFDKVADKIRQDQIDKAEKTKRQKEIAADEASGVVTVGIAPAKH